MMYDSIYRKREKTNVIILSTKLKNSIAKKAKTENLNVQLVLHNIDINGRKTGCSGFIHNMDNNVYVYVNTDMNTTIHEYMYRYADNAKDYTGYRNRWAGNIDNLVSGIITCLRQTPQQARDKKY